MSSCVIVGEYENTSFDKIKEGENLQKLGPFSSYEDAKKEWDRISWSHVDNCNVRYIILPHK